jgi:ubiquinone/menaquinone biosynthesis C-methylase UbiE/uncharacterized protein YbaR (Trm112 family)
MYKKLMSKLKCIKCDNFNLQLDEQDSDGDQIITGSITCSACSAFYPIRSGVPEFLDDFSKVSYETSEHYGNAWVRSFKYKKLDNKWHFDEMIKVHNFPVDMKGWGIEGGCGNGRDSVRLSYANPESDIISLDLSEGVYVTQLRINHLKIKNIHPIRCNLDNIPLRNECVNFAYSFGVLHHMPIPVNGMTSLSRVMKPGSSIVTYLYSDLKEKPFLKVMLIPIQILRQLTKRLPLSALRVFSFIFSPFVFTFLTIPAKLLKLVNLDDLSKSIPHHHNVSVKSVYGELYDRFGARIEYRYNPSSLNNLYTEAGIKMDGYEQIPIWRGWVSYGHKPKI